MKKLILCMSMMATMASAQDVFLRGNIVMTTTQLQPQGGDVYRGEVTLDDADVFLFSDKYVYFECPSTGYKSGNIRINGGHYTATFNLSTKAWSFEAPTDENRISAFGSSVCNGQGLALRPAVEGTLGPGAVGPPLLRLGHLHRRQQHAEPAGPLRRDDTQLLEVRHHWSLAGQRGHTRVDQQAADTGPVLDQHAEDHPEDQGRRQGARGDEQLHAR